MKYKIYDIVLFNKQGDMSVGIITKIDIVSSGEDGILYHVYPNNFSIRADNITRVLGNAEEIQGELESQSDEVRYEHEEK